MKLHEDEEDKTPLSKNILERTLRKKLGRDELISEEDDYEYSE